MNPSFNRESAVRDAKAMQGFESESFLMGAEHFQKVRVDPIKSGYASKDCDLASPNPESRFNVSTCLPICAVIDGMGLYGHFLHYGIVIALVGSAFLIFLYLWRSKRLDIDEGPKFQMMREEEMSKEERDDYRTKK